MGNIKEIRDYINSVFSDGDVFICRVTGNPIVYMESMLYNNGDMFLVRINETTSGFLHSSSGVMAEKFERVSTPSIEDWRKEVKLDKRKEVIDDLILKSRIKSLSKQ